VEAAPTEHNAEINLHQNINSKMTHVTGFYVNIFCETVTVLTHKLTWGTWSHRWYLPQVATKGVPLP